MKTRWPRCAASSALADKFLSDSAGFPGARIQFFPAAQARPQRPCQTERRGPRIRPRAEKGESRIHPGHLAALIQKRYGIAIHRTTVLRGLKKNCARRGKSWREAFVARTIPCRGFMKMCVARHSRTRSQLPGRWSAFADMEWPACSPAGNRIFPSFFAHRVFLVRPGAGERLSSRETS